ncbi:MULTISPECIES: proline--tRNA ligase [Dethiosulfovibrio]|jgi:prolyl-tRNA synthetase|uniref:Proline--tRNA ligase n=2 Tax=Dethiosulfovibrio TaxID=47054 RepID=A0ABS9ENZ7_9BACT|nr:MULTISPECIES: proline--tRNA ligase [Dethiosulfovibrio]MCF4114428.1 proline--tRNA ligase [Dethiosulfovibrio russensis]MCF4142911.1 proline--tRNA ligase [Dethiosulfovibrio marinus]MCF4145008.1 proline--tRNA ligase [Dethiosulfovibrio acidaminovorans]
MARNITSRQQDYSQWYLDVIKVAELADYAPVRGCMVIRPTGYSVWEEIQQVFDRAFKETGHVNAYFPVLIPNSFLEKEAEHVEGFSPECAVVTHAGGEELEEPLVVRPTSETVIGHMYSKWIQSWRDLPLLINQWANVMRWEKRPRLFLRTSEFLWQEGHTAHASKEEAIEETERMLEVYRRIMTDYLALPVVPGVKSEGERFPGAEETYTTETMMSDMKALQAGTSHFLGQNFSKAFNIQFQNKEEAMEYAWTTSWGVSTRLIGAVIMTHSDDDGLILPPRIAPTKVALLSISKDETMATGPLLSKAKELAGKIESVIGARTVAVDDQFHMRPGDRFFYHLQKGVPLRLELGEKEFEKGTVRAVRRDTGEKIDLPWDGIETKVNDLLETIQEDLLNKARSFREVNTHEVSDLDGFKKTLEKKGGFIKAYFAGTKEDEKAIKEATGATVRCFPLEDKDTRGKCFFTGKDDARMAIFAKSY